ncbi:MAG TPA: acyl-CoA dehydrogenase family protein [Candidatus Limnocylindrales bacterium]|jgi:alkylation response protein AidB-like acyl-CoA dehydrogenase
MSENFFSDNPDLQFRLEQLDLREALEFKEKGYAEAETYPGAPRNYADAKDNYRIVLEVLGEVCGERVAPRAAEADEEGAHFEHGEVTYAAATLDAIEALRQAELFGAMLPREYGGLNLPESIYQMMVEVVARAESGLMTVYGLQEIASMIDEYGDPETKARVLPKFARGEVSGAMVLTEADAGSDLGAVATRATLDDATGQWHLNGVKRFITNGLADISVVLARSEEGSTDARGLSMFLVERDDTVKIRRIENKMGIHASPTCEIQYNNTPAILVGKRRFGLMRYAMNLMNGARLAVGAQALGIAEAAYREADRYSRERIQFGKPIRSLPAVSRLLLSMRVDLESSRALLAETARWVDLWKVYDRAVGEGTAPDMDAARARLRQCQTLAETLTPMVKYCATEMGNRVCYQSMQVHGGVGYMREFNIERLFRDVRITNIYEGTSQLQVVAAIGKILNHSLDPLLAEWRAASYPADMAAEKAILDELTDVYGKAVDALKAQPERDRVDYYACDLVDTAVWLVNCWLLLRDTNVLESKKAVARTYIASVAPRLRASAGVVMAASPVPLEAIPALLG